MAADPERPPADDTVVVDADELAAQEEEWPLADLYRVEPESEVGSVPAEPSVQYASSATRRRFPPAVGPGVPLSIAAILAALVLGALFVAARGDDSQPESLARTPQTTPASTTPEIDTPAPSTTTAPPAEGQSTQLAPRPRPIDVPSVVGSMASSAVVDLREAGLAARIRLVTSSERPGVVIRQSPTDGAEVGQGTTVSLDVSRGRPVPPKVEVPNLVGMTVADARTQLRGLGLSVLVTKVASDEPAGTVLRQSPGSGAEVREDASVTLTVSSGLETVEIPDVTGLDEESARGELEAVGFQVEATDEPTSDPAQDGVVLRQSPAGTSSATRGSVVTIVVARLG